jgi:predicted dehydrogenase
MKRREFLQTTSTGIAASIGYSMLKPAASALAQSSAAPMRLGIIGPGSRGQELIRQFMRVPGVDVTAACDIYEPRFAQTEKLLGHAVAHHHDYRELIDRKDLDAIVIATPPRFHGQYVSAALRSGRPVYGEKVMGFTVQDSRDIVAAARESKQHYQVGHEYRYAPWFTEAIRRVHAGEIGHVTHVYGYWHRNNNWRRPVPDPKDERLINWRLYKESSMGLLAELGSHMVDTANWVFDSMPESVLASGSIVEYHDGRETDDNVQAIYNYSEGRRFIFSALANNAILGNQLWIYGDKGSVQLTIEDATFFYEKKAFAALAPTNPVVEKGMTTGASYSTKGEMPYRGEGSKVKIDNYEDATLTACRSFITSVRENKRPFADEIVGYGSAVAITLGYQAKEEERLIRFGDNAKV